MKSNLVKSLRKMLEKFKYEYNLSTEQIALDILEKMEKYNLVIKCDPSKCNYPNCEFKKISKNDCYKNESFKFYEKIFGKPFDQEERWYIKNENLVYDKRILNNILVLKNILVYFIMGIYSNKSLIEEDLQEITNIFKSIIETLFPFSIQHKHHRKYLYETLIVGVVENNYYEIALDLYREYSIAYNISIRLLVNRLDFNNPQFKRLSRENIIYLIMILEAEKKSIKNTNVLYCKNALLKLIDSCNLVKEEWKYYDLQKETDKLSVQKIIYDMSNKFLQLCDVFEIIDEKTDLLFTKPNKKIDNISKRLIITIKNEFGRCFDAEYKNLDFIYKKWIKVLKQELEKRYQTFTNKTFLLAKNITIEEKKEMVKKFLKLGFCHEIDDVTPTKNRLFVNTGIINYIDEHIENCVLKISNNDTLLNMIAGGEQLFVGLENLPFEELECDYTFLVTSQIKIVERYLKEVMLKYLSGTTIKIGKVEQTIRLPIDMNLSDLENIDAEELDEDQKRFLKIELGSIHFFFKNCITRNQNQTIFDTQSNRSIFIGEFNKFFIQKVRNGHFHTSTIKSINNAQSYRKSTAFWLLCILTELKGL